MGLNLPVVNLSPSDLAVPVLQITRPNSCLSQRPPAEMTNCEAGNSCALTNEQCGLESFMRRYQELGEI